MGKLRNASLSNVHIINFAKYSERRYAQEFPNHNKPAGYSAYMMTDENVPAEEDKLTFAVLDTGCNNTCHGDRWMMRYAKTYGFMPEAEEADGVMVSCKRTIHMCMRTLDEELIPGTIASIELEDSDAPVLLSAGTQQKLGLVLDMGNNTIYSPTLDKELELVTHNGLPSIAQRLFGYHRRF